MQHANFIYLRYLHHTHTVILHTSLNTDTQTHIQITIKYSAVKMYSIHKKKCLYKNSKYKQTLDYKMLLRIHKKKKPSEVHASLVSIFIIIPIHFLFFVFFLHHQNIGTSYIQQDKQCHKVYL